MKDSISWDGTGLTILGILIYGFIALASPTITFNLSLVITLLIVVFACEMLANIVSAHYDRKGDRK